MGISSIWDDLQHHIRVEELARIAMDHYDAHKRPFRIAVDVAGWMFNNVTKEQVAYFRRIGQDAARTDIKNIYCHITTLLALNIELLVVFDGKNRAPKQDRGFNGRDFGMRHERNQDLLSMLDALNVPYYEALGEAEAECAMLQMKGPVDAVWSEDSDTLMFGCSLLLRFHKDGSHKQWHTADVLHSSDIQTGLGFDQAALVLFAIMQDYPSFEVLKKYMQPKTSSEHDLRKLPFIKNRELHHFDEENLFMLSTGFFNQFGKLYMERVTPILLTRWLLNSASNDNPHAIEIPRRRKDNEIKGTSSFVKVKLSPFGLTSLPESVYANQWQKVQPHKTNTRFKEQVCESTFKVEFQYTPRALVERALPQLLLQDPQRMQRQTPAKRKLLNDTKSSCKRRTEVKLTPKTALKNSGDLSEPSRLSTGTSRPVMAGQTPTATPSRIGSSTNLGKPAQLKTLTLSGTDDEESDPDKTFMNQPVLKHNGNIPPPNIILAYDVIDLTED